MRLLLATLVLVATMSVARADVAQPVRVNVQCEETGRTKFCPAFLMGFVDAHPVLRNVPRAAADVIIYATANQAGNTDQLLLRFVGTVTGAPPLVEIRLDLDTRGNDEAQRAQIQPAFLRGIALFVAARYPESVAITLAAPADAAGTSKEEGSPWGIALNIGGSGNYTERFRSGNGEAALVGRYLKPHFRALTLNVLQGGLTRQPPLMLEDGSSVSLNANQWAFRFGAEAIWSWNDRWSAGIGSYTSIEDKRSQFRYTSRTRAAIEWDLFKPDDPRGNRLGIFYHLGYVAERYNIRNEIGERFARYAVHGIDAVGSIRKDKITLGINLETQIQLWHPNRRRSITASPFTTIQIGDRVDLSLSFSITQRELPPPDMNEIDPMDFAQLSRLSFAEPLALSGSLGLSIHFDPTNGVRNNRIESI